MNYLDKIDDKILEYYKLLEPNFPNWLNDYISAPIMLKQKYISMSCGTIYSNLYDNKFFYSSLDHSIGVSLILWHFTKDKKQTLSGLFHDIATPVFKHSIDYLNKDYMKQESTEEKTHELIKNSKEIMSLLKKDNIKINEIDNYHLYPIADNDTPKLSSDRLEYSLSNALFTYNLLTLDQVKEIYDDIYICVNEENEKELAFKTKKLARLFTKVTSQMSIYYRDDKTRYSMEFIATITKKLIEDKLIKQDDLYNKKEIEIINIIENSKYSKVFNIWKNATKVSASNKEVNYFSVNIKVKVRYINALVNDKRIYDICKVARKYIDNNLNYDMDKYVYIEDIKEV